MAPQKDRFFVAALLRMTKLADYRRLLPLQTSKAALYLKEVRAAKVIGYARRASKGRVSWHILSKRGLALRKGNQ